MPESGALKVSNPLDEAGIAQLAAQAGNAANLLKVLGNERRLMIACLLMMRGEMPVGEIVAAPAPGIEQPGPLARRPVEQPACCRKALRSARNRFARRGDDRVAGGQNRQRSSRFI